MKGPLLESRDRWYQLDYARSEAFPERYHIPYDHNEDKNPDTKGYCLLFPSPDPSSEFEDKLGGQHTPANELTGHTIPNLGTNGIGTFSHGPQSSSPPPTFAGRNNCPSRGAANSTEAPQADTQALEGRRCNEQPPSERHCQYNSAHCPPVSENISAQMLPVLCASIPTGDDPVAIAESRSAHYPPFRSIFSDTEAACNFRKAATRFKRKPYRHPDADVTISTIANDRQAHVKRIYDAMTRGDAAKDNNGSIAMRRWVHAAFYPPELVEAYAHKVLDCLLQQVEQGFRGWHHNDYASDDRKGEPEDKNVSCAERLDNIIRALEEEKTICEDVMASACQIRMFVNAPRAYARRKEANRHGNSKRGKANHTNHVISSRISKPRGPNMRQATRSRRSTPCTSPPAAMAHPHQDIDIQVQNQLPHLPYYLKPPSQVTSSPPAANHLPPKLTAFMPHPSHSDGGIISDNRMTTTPPPPPQPHANIPPIASIPLQHNSPLLSSLSIRRSQALSPGTLDDHKGLSNDLSTSWPHADSFGNSSSYLSPPDEALFDFALWNMETGRPSSSGMRYPGEVQSTHMSGFDEANIDPSFYTYWSSQSNAQPFP